MSGDDIPLDTQRYGAVVLAGGLARRMGGVDKGLISIADKPMIQHVVEAVAPSVAELVINANRNLAVYEELGYPVVQDDIPGHLGPLAGLNTGLNHLSTRYVFMCPCDSPFIDSNLVRALFKSCEQEAAEIAVAHDGQRLQPVFCVVDRKVAPSLQRFLNAGERKIDKWFLQHRVCEVEAKSYENSFRNINTIEEKVQAETDLGLMHD